MLAVGTGKEFAPTWDKEFVRQVLSTSTESLDQLIESRTQQNNPWSDTIS